MKKISAFTLSLWAAQKFFTADANVSSGSAAKEVGARASGEGVVSSRPVEVVVPSAPEEDIRASRSMSAINLVAAAGSDQSILIHSPAYEIRATASPDAVAARQRGYDIVSGSSDDDVIVGRSHDRGGLSETNRCRGMRDRNGTSIVNQ